MASAGDPRALGELLRSRRERLAPADRSGLPPGIRRRTGGLRREVGRPARQPVRHLLHVPRAGRQARPSEQVLDALAAALRMTPCRAEVPAVPGVRAR